MSGSNATSAFDCRAMLKAAAVVAAPSAPATAEAQPGHRPQGGHRQWPVADYPTRL